MKLRLKLAQRALKRKAGTLSRQINVHNFDTAKTVGVLWSFDEKNAFQTIQQHLNGYKNVKLNYLYFIPEKNADTSDGNSFCLSQLSWLGFVKEGAAIDFEKENFDLLIDLSVKKQFPMQVIATLSNAAFKVGYCAEENNPYDLIIDIHQKPSPEYLAEQIINYLNLIIKKQA